MKGGAIIILVAIIAGILLLMVALGIFNPLQTYDVTAEDSTPSIEIEFNYDYSPFIIDESGFSDLDDATRESVSTMFCERLRMCIRNANITGESCEVGTYSFGNNFEDVQSMFFHCNNLDINVPITSSIEQKLCTFSPSSFDISPKPDDQGYSDSAGMYFRECDIGVGLSNTYEELNILKEEYNSPPGVVRIYYSPDYFTSINYPNYHESTILSSLYFDTISTSNEERHFYLTPGKAKFVVPSSWVDYSSSEDRCVFNLLMCPVPYLAEYRNQDILKIFDYVRRLPVQHFTEDDIPYYVYDGSTSDTKDIYKYNTFVIDTEDSYEITRVINAVKFGFYENSRINTVFGKNIKPPESSYGGTDCDDSDTKNCPRGYICKKEADSDSNGICCPNNYPDHDSDRCFNNKNNIWKLPHWEVKEDNSLDSDCWKSSYPTDDIRSIFYKDSNSDGYCNGEIKINIRMTRSFPDKDKPNEDAKLSTVTAVCCE